MKSRCLQRNPGGISMRQFRAGASMDLPEGKRITVTPTGAALGADVAGVDLMKPLDPALFKAIEMAWHQHLVLRFRG
jgi:hypothetical protein